MIGWIKKQKTSWPPTFSVAVPFVLIILAVGIFPILLQGIFLSGTVRQSQIDNRRAEVLNQCKIISSKMTRAGYFSPEYQDIKLNMEMEVAADIFNGRIVIVDKSYRIVKDTFGLAEGRLNIAEEIILCFQGEMSNVYNEEKNYFVQTVPIYHDMSEKKIDGVMMVTASTESLNSVKDSIKEKSRFFDLIAILILAVTAAAMARFLLEPFRNLARMLEKAAEGDLDTEIEEGTYLETQRISDAISRTMRKLKAVDKSRQEFVSNVSHELKTPITSIRVLADSLMSMEEVPVELYQEFMQDISDEIDRESKIIDDLLSLVKMNKSAADMNISQVSINDLLGLILKRIRPIAQKRNIELILESIREVTAEVDEVKLSLALNNLVENAVKYNVEDGWVRVILDADHKYFYIKVSDFGIGIPEEFQELIFERFYRVDKARSRETGGTGLGLSITKNVILMHQGIIKVESKEGEGTTFSVRIPLTYIQ
ncbi:MAG: sensor histidine kinase [Lachnospiraceae bacterium]